MAYYQIALRLLLSFVIAVSPIILINSANAANVGGWTLGGGVAQGASTVYDATKNVLINGKKFIKESSVKITPNASQVAKVLARGAAGYALSVAVEQLLGSVDWVLDPANNRIRYSVGAEPSDLAGWKEICIAEIKKQYPEGHQFRQAYINNAFVQYRKNNTEVACLSRNPITHTNVLMATFPVTGEQSEEKSISLDVVAQQVISNAAAGDTNAQAATTAAAADIVSEAEKDDAKARPIASQAEANATTKPADAADAENANDALGQSKPNTENPDITDISLEFPIFCNWAPTVCEAAQIVISFPRTLTDWWNTSNEKADSWVMSITEAWASVRDWATTEKQNDSTEIEIEKPQQETVDTDISFNASCPAPYTLASFTAFGSSHNWTIDFSEMCSAITTFVRPVVIAMGALSAALIIGGVRDNG
ncbi:virulence factor TspB C-terminal domain-related protein [Acinetobacter bohemicus]|uniref:virulence factor TspB C-terminal domain-related protein n=1 Tax=Acinetobacter TaxID=469 RepID=UPI00209A768D|nr:MULTISPECIES: virulence factor TspB C-terminal domain-related protein [Acinetobacter]MCO8043673.1 hypothetical protein [Acinetobacter sp. S4400-12]MCU7225922.1 virulence factor TspB C-terminal domain-related protein [Acinetobacter bohemicus]